MNKTNLFLICMTGFACAACVPFRFIDRPGVSGRVYDASTGHPVASMEVVLRTEEVVLNAVLHTDGNRTSGTTSIDGRYQIRPLTRWGTIPVPGDPTFGKFYCKITFEKQGYRTTTKKFASNSFGPPIIELKDVMIAPEKPARK
jgi:hypothetical protein